MKLFISRAQDAEDKSHINEHIPPKLNSDSKFGI